MRKRNCDSANSKVLTVGAVSIKLPEKGCCIVFANLETMTITLKRDKADAIIFTLTPDNLTAYTSVSIECMININKAINISLSVIKSNLLPTFHVFSFFFLTLAFSSNLLF